MPVLHYALFANIVFVLEFRGNVYPNRSRSGEQYDLCYGPMRWKAIVGVFSENKHDRVEATGISEVAGQRSFDARTWSAGLERV